MFALPRRLNLLFSIGLALMGALVIWLGARSVSGATDTTLNSPISVANSAATGPSLHNPTLDNHDWYEFNWRYQRAYYDGAWLPDDDDNLNDDIPEHSRQDWRLWFMDGTAIIETDPEAVYAHADEAIQMRPYEWGKDHDQVAGLYQPIYNTTPCLFYEFQMYGQSRPEDPSDYRTAALKVGIDQAGWHPNSATDPAVHGDFPSTTVWGPAHDYKFAYAPLTVTAEALGNKITVFTYGDAPGGRYHRVLWDTGSFQEVIPETLHDPQDLPAPGDIYNLELSLNQPGTTSVNISWSTIYQSLGQVYYRQLPSGGTTPPDYPDKVFLPLVTGSGLLDWLVTPLDKTYTNDHIVTLGGLISGRSYEFIVVSRGATDGQCVTWVSEVQSFIKQ
jgi:hypothetical protein